MEIEIKDPLSEKFKETTQKVRAHLKKHKLTYLVGATGVAAYLIKGNVTRQTIANGVLYKSTQHNTNIYVELARRGHPGYEVLCHETGEKVASISRMAEIEGIDPRNLSKHLHGKAYANGINGKTYEIIGEM